MLLFLVFFSLNKQEDGHPPYAAHLRLILNTVIQQIHESGATIMTETSANDKLITQISGNNFHYRFTCNGSMSIKQAEAHNMYSFLRYVTNYIGYSIVDFK